MNFSLLLTGFLIGMLIGVLIMIRIDSQHEKEMKKIEDDFNEWKRMRAKQFMAELDEMNSKPYEYWRDRAEEDMKVKTKIFNPYENQKLLSNEHRYVTNPKTRNPIDFMKERDKNETNQ